MAPIANVFNFNQVPVDQETPMSRTHQYRKVMKPLLERKRRARINRCLDDLKDLMVFALESEGESMAKLEKADVLELTVKHLQKLKRQNMLETTNPALNVDRFRSGFSACATEVSRFISNVPGIDMSFGTGLMTHLGNSVNNIRVPLSVNTISSSSSSSSMPMSPSSDGGYTSGRDSSPSPPVSVGCPSPVHCQQQEQQVIKQEAAGVWRPF